VATYKPTYPTQLEIDASNDEARRDIILAELKQALEGTLQMEETLKASFLEPECKLNSKQQASALKACKLEAKNKAAKLKEEIKLLQDKMKRADRFEYENYRKHAEDWFQKAAKVGTTSGKSKLYLGNRQYVTAHALKDKDKEKRYLNAGVWSWGVNLAWIEGGIGARVTFEIKFEPSDEFSGFPGDSLDRMMMNPRMSAQQWLALCADFPGTLLWHDGEDRPTWFAKEVEAALAAGYHFVFGTTKKGDTKLTLETRA